MVLLASYASAVTLGLIWVLWSGRTAPREPSEPDAVPAGRAHAPDPGRRAGQSRQVVPPPPIAADRIVDAGPDRSGRLARGHAAGGLTPGR